MIGAFVVSPETFWYARVLFLFSASAMIDTGSKSFDFALVSTLKTHDDPEKNGNYFVFYVLLQLLRICALNCIMIIVHIIAII
jgi:hypothetical protein